MTMQSDTTYSGPGEDPGPLELPPDAWTPAMMAAKDAWATLLNEHGKVSVSAGEMWRRVADAVLATREPDEYVFERAFMAAVDDLNAGRLNDDPGHYLAMVPTARHEEFTRRFSALMAARGPEPGDAVIDEKGTAPVWTAPEGSRLMVDGEGFVWWVHSDAMSMVRTDPSNRRSPDPWTFYEPVDRDLIKEDRDEWKQRAEAAETALDQRRELLTELSIVAVEQERRAIQAERLAEHWEAQHDAAIRMLTRSQPEHARGVEWPSENTD